MYSRFEEQCFLLQGRRMEAMHFCKTSENFYNYVMVTSQKKWGTAVRTAKYRL